MSAAAIMNSRQARPDRFSLLLSLPGALILMGILQIGIALLVYILRGDRILSLEIWIVTVMSSTSFTLLLVLPRLKREQRALEVLVASRTQALIDANNQLTEEIQEREQVEQTLRQREATLRKVQEIAHIGSWEADMIALKITWSEEMYRIHGRDPNLPPPDPSESLTLVHPEDHGIHEQYIRASVRAQKPFSTDLRIVRSTGEIRYLEARGEPVFDENQQMVRYIGMSRDLTERKLTEEKLRKSESLLREAQACANLGCWEHDCLTHQTVWTETLYNIHGRDPALPPPNGQELMEQVIYPEDLPVYQQHLLEKYVASQPFACDFRIRRVDGDIRWLTAKGEPVFNTQGQLIRYVGIVMDISDRKQAELDLQTAKDAAESANRAKSIFLSSMSHELRTPLNAILGFTQLLDRDTSLTQEQRRYLDTINRNGQYLLELINDVLAVSKIEVGQVELHEDNFDLHQLLANLEELFRSKATAKNLVLSVEYPPTIPQFMYADGNKLRQILINLLSNAIKFTSTGQVTLRVSPLNEESETSWDVPPTKLHFEVQDTGVGIATEELTQLFQPFAQTQAGRQANEGTGLGLVICQRFVELMGGSIGVRSTSRQGSIFWFTLPILPAKSYPLPVSLPTRRVIGLEPDQPSYRILIVEDQIENAEFLQQILSIVGFEVQQARNGQEGIAIWEDWKPHLILMDMRMPVMDGYAASRIIKETPQGQQTIIIAATGSAFEEDRSRILAIGCDDFIRKPCQENVLFAKIAQHLGVRYRYQDLPSSNLINGLNQLATVSAGDLSVMPPTWITTLNRAARECDAPAVADLLEQIPAEFEPLALALRQLATNFRFEEIAVLTEIDSSN